MKINGNMSQSGASLTTIGSSSSSHDISDIDRGNNSMINPTFMRAVSGDSREKRPSSVKTSPGKLLMHYSFRSAHDLGTWWSCFDMRSSR